MLPACEDPPSTQAAQEAADDPAAPAEPTKASSGSSAVAPAPASGPKKPAFAKPTLGGARKPLVGAGWD